MVWKELQDHIEVGIIHRTLYPESKRDERILLNTLDLITHDLFFERIELHTLKDPTIRKEVKRRLAITRMKTTYATSPKIFEHNLDINSIDSGIRKHAVKELKNYFEDALDFGADSITMISGPMVNEHYEDAKQALVESVMELSQIAEKIGLDLHLELHDYNIDKKRFMGPTREAIDLLNRLQGQCPAFYFLIDNSHFPLLGESVEEAVFPLANNIGYVHIGSSVLDVKDPRYGDHHPYFGYPAGMNDTKEIVQFLKALAQVGYLKPGRKAPITIEHMIGKGERPEDLIVNGKRTLRNAWAEFINDQNTI
jgi:sugar phosphate isomerase/epimerase